MGDLRGILNTNVTDAGGKLDEATFFAAVSAVSRTDKPHRVSEIIVSPATVERAHSDIERWENAADAAKMEVYRLRRGWRNKIRFIARRRAAERYMDNRLAADALAGTFGRR
jgi:hypothetical protein